MPNAQEIMEKEERRDALDSYFECITACSLDEAGVECVTRCVDIHLKEEFE